MMTLLGMYFLVLAAGGSKWLGLAATTLMALDPLLFVHSRIATLDIYAVALMLWATIAFVRGKTVIAGILLGVATACKLVAPYLLLAWLIFELLRRAPWRQL